MGETCKSKAEFIKAMRSTSKPRDFLASLTKYFFSDDPDERSVFEEALMEASIKVTNNLVISLFQTNIVCLQFFFPIDSVVTLVA